MQRNWCWKRTEYCFLLCCVAILLPPTVRRSLCRAAQCLHPVLFLTGLNTLFCFDSFTDRKWSLLLSLPGGCADRRVKCNVCWILKLLWLLGKFWESLSFGVVRITYSELDSSYSRVFCSWRWFTIMMHSLALQRGTYAGIDFYFKWINIAVEAVTMNAEWKLER